MKTIEEKIKTLNALVQSGRLLDAFDLYYHPEISMQENEQPPVIGKHANLLRETDFFSKAKGFSENAIPLDVTVGNDVSMVRWRYKYDHDEWGSKNYTQVSVQHWKDGLIIKEQFFYGN